MTSSPPDPVFEQPWHAQLFALTVSLNEQGYFSWPEWAEKFGATLKIHGVARSLNGGEEYFLAWLDALEGFLSGRGLAQTDEMRVLKEAWTEAYLSTPHGSPVSIG
jgi:nitrile hydratase accessory protein